MKILHFFLLCISVFGHKTINHWTKFHGKKIFKIIIVNIRYGGYHILVQKVFEGDLSCDCICKKLKFDTPRIKNGQSYGTIKVKPRGSWIIWHRPDRYQRISAIFNFRLNYFFYFKEIARNHFGIFEWNSSSVNQPSVTNAERLFTKISYDIKFAAAVECWHLKIAANKSKILNRIS